jgi:hypothetical protein
MISDAAVGGPYAALVEHDQDPHYGGEHYAVQVFDLSSGLQLNTLGGEQIGCADYDGYSCDTNLDDVTINAHGFTAAHITSTDYEFNTATQATQVRDDHRLLLDGKQRTTTHVRLVVDSQGRLNPTASPESDSVTAAKAGPRARLAAGLRHHVALHASDLFVHAGVVAVIGVCWSFPAGPTAARARSSRRSCAWVLRTCRMSTR